MKNKNYTSIAIWAVAIISLLMIAFAINSKTKVRPLDAPADITFDASEFVKQSNKIGENYPAKADCPPDHTGKMEEDLRYKKIINKTYSCSNESSGRKMIFTAINNDYITRTTSIYPAKSTTCDPDHLKKIFSIEGDATANGQFQWQIQNATAQWANPISSELRIFAACDIYTHEFWIGASSLAAEVSIQKGKGPVFLTSDSVDASLLNEFRTAAEQKGLLNGRSKLIFESSAAHVLQ